MGLTDRRRKKGAKSAGILAAVITAIVVCGVVGAAGSKAWKTYQKHSGEPEMQTGISATEYTQAEDTQSAEEGVIEPAGTYYALADQETTDFSEDADVKSPYAILVDVSEKRIVAQRNGETKMNPASMTKVLTLLVAAENVDLNKLNEVVELSMEANDFAYVNGCSTANFETGDRITLRDLFYGTILPSGGEAAYQLAMYTAGSHEAFVDLMNDKLEELGISDTAHFTNCIGLNDANHYCTVYDMAVIMEAAMDNEFCRKVLSARTYDTSPIKVAPEGETLSNKFLRRIEDKYTAGTIVGAKTGYTVEAGSCAVSYATAADGKDYICVTGAAEGGWTCIYDHVEIYNIFTGDIQANLEEKARLAAESTESAAMVETTEEETPEQ